MVHLGPPGPYQKMTIPLLNSPKPHPLLKVSSDNLQVFVQCDTPRNGMWGKRGIMGGGGCLFEACPQKR